MAIKVGGRKISNEKLSKKRPENCLNLTDETNFL